jgi:hypothetical protein
MGAYQHQSIGTRVHLGVLCYVPIRHPRTNDVERKLRPLIQGILKHRKVDDREYVGMRNGLAPTRGSLVWSALSTPLILKK